MVPRFYHTRLPEKVDMSRPFDLAQNAYKAGRKNDAISMLQQIVALDPRNAEAHHLLGVIEAREGRLDSALQRFETAVRLAPKKLPYLVDRANAVASSGRTAEAIEAYDRVLAINPKLIEALSNKGQALRLQGNLSEAEDCFRQAIRHDPTFVDAHRALGDLRWGMLRFEEAIESYSAVLAHQLADVKSILHRGICRTNIRQFDKALADFKWVIKLVPDHAEAHARAGHALNELENFKAAFDYVNRAIALDPKNAEWRGYRCKTLIGLDRPREALREAELMSDLGAAEDFQLMWKAMCFLELHQFEDAEEIYNRMIQRKPESGFWYFNRGVALAKQRRYPEACSAYDESIARDPAFPIAPWNKSLCTLVQGDETGFELYEWRWKLASGGPAHENQPKGIPKWNGYEDIRGKRVLLSAEQGFGDSLMFCRFAPLVKAMGATVDIGLPKPLRRVISTLPGIDDVIDPKRPEPLPRYDFFCPLMSLPRILDVKLDDIPFGKTSYLSSDPALVEKWRPILDHATCGSGRPRIGLMWGGRKVISLGSRSINLDDLLAILDRRFDFISLQKELPDGDDLRVKSNNIHHFGNEQEDFADAAAIIELVDLVITIDTSIAHLSGALGKETWVLLQFDSEWRWLIDRTDSPWYPNARLFRQAAPGDWGSVIEQVQATMKARWP